MTSTCQPASDGAGLSDLVAPFEAFCAHTVETKTPKLKEFTTQQMMIVGQTLSLMVILTFLSSSRNNCSA